MSAELKCPNCGTELNPMTLRCDHCEITFVRCEGCGRFQPEWVSICAYCNSPVHGGISVDSGQKRAIEVDDETAHTVPTAVRKPRKPTMHERLHRLDTQARGKIEAGKSRPKPPLRNTPVPFLEEKADPSITTKRAHHVTHDFDPQVAQDELQKEERKRMRRWRATERLNPNWFYRQSAVPAMLVLLGLMWAYGDFRYSARSYVEPDITDFIPHMLIGVGILWMVLLAFIDRIRLIK
jgi:hypothetical protein